jgi:hypothetical protein
MLVNCAREAVHGAGAHVVDPVGAVVADNPVFTGGIPTAVKTPWSDSSAKTAPGRQDAAAVRGHSLRCLMSSSSCAAQCRPDTATVAYTAHIVVLAIYQFIQASVLGRSAYVRALNGAIARA